MGYEKQLVRGALINLVGLVAKLIHPLFLVVVPWLFGTEIMGLYFIAMFIIAILNYMVYAGYSDATTIFASEFADDPEHEDQLYQVFANAILIPMVLSAAVIIISTFAIEPFVAAVYPDRPELVDALHVLVWTVPLLSLTSILIATTKALMRMEYEVSINSTTYPLALVGFVVVAWWLDGGLLGLMWSRVLAQALAMLLSIWAFGRHFSFAKLLRAITHFRFNRDMLIFVLPQNLNMTFNRYITRLDVLMLGAFGYSNHAVAFYGAGALITSNLREIKQIFTSILGPIIARHHAAKNRQGMIDDLSKVVRWTTTLGVPAVLMTLILRNDILLLLDEGFSGDTLFMAILLVSPFLSCATGLAGNSIVWTRHSTWNLLNSFTIAGLNTALNWFLIPVLGLTGAALATITASILVSIAQMVELYYLEGAFIRLSEVFKPWIGLALGMTLVLVFWDPAQLGNLGTRLGLALAVLPVYFVFMLLLKHPEVMSFSSKIGARFKVA